MEGGILLGTFKKTFKMFNVEAEEQVQVFLERTEMLNYNAVELLDPVLSVTFDRVILLKDKAIVQGNIYKNIIYKDENFFVRHEIVTIPVTATVEIPGFNPTVTVGRANRAVVTNNVVDIGPDNQGDTNGFDIQIFVKQLTAFQRLINANEVEEKIILDFILKISKFDQIDLEIPAPPRVFEFRNVIDP